MLGQFAVICKSSQSVRQGYAGATPSSSLTVSSLSHLSLDASEASASSYLFLVDLGDPNDFSSFIPPSFGSLRGWRPGKNRRRTGGTKKELLKKTEGRRQDISISHRVGL